MFGVNCCIFVCGGIGVSVFLFFFGGGVAQSHVIFDGGGVMTTVTECHRGGGRGEAKISKKSVTYFVYGP